MDYQKHQEELKQVKSEIIHNFSNVVRYHDVSEEIIYFANRNIENFFEWMIKFYEYAEREDNSSKKGLILSMVNTLSNLNIPMTLDWEFESPIEFLLYSALEMTMPQRVKNKMFLMPQTCICDGKYRLDIVLMLRQPFVKSGVEGIPVIGIECDGYEYHYGTAEKTTQTLERIRKIKMETGIEIFQYTGKEIYSDCTKLAKDFWEYVERFLLRD